jgi:hypothetical protein
MFARAVFFMTVAIMVHCWFILPNLEADEPTKFITRVDPFLSEYCASCHDDVERKGDVSFDDLYEINSDNARLWKSIWEQVALKQMPPKKKKTQPQLEERHQLTEDIVEELQRMLEDKGGFHDHLHPSKGNLLDHDLLFGESLKNLEPASSPARIWRLHPQEQFTRLNELVTIEPPYNPEKPGVRARGDHVPASSRTGTVIYLGVHDVVDWIGTSFSLHHGLKKITPILSTKVKRGLQHYPYLYSVNSAETLRIANDAEAIIRFMAFGPDANAFQFADHVSDIDEKHKGIAIYKGRTIQTKHGVPEGVFYYNKSKRPITPIYDLMAKPGVNDKRLKAAADFLFEALTLRPPTNEESAAYLRILKKSIADLGKEEGIILGLAPIFLDRAALFRTELCETGTPDKYGRVMLQGQELALAINAAFSYIGPDMKLKHALEGGRLKTREDVKREVTRMLNDDSIRKPVILRFFKEYFDYDLASKVDKDDILLKKAGGGSSSKSNRQLMVEMAANTDRLVELILKEDKNVLSELLTTDRAIMPKNVRDEGYFREMSKDGKIVDENGNPLFVLEGNKFVSVTEKDKALLPVKAKDLPGFIVDNTDAKVIGEWTTSSHSKHRVGSDYLITEDQSNKVIYPVNFPKAGKYEVRIILPKDEPKVSIKILVIVRHKGGEKKYRLNPKINGSFLKRRSDSYFQSLGFFEFPAGPWDAVEVSAHDGNVSLHDFETAEESLARLVDWGVVVVADAVQFLEARAPQAIEKETKLAMKPGGKTIHVRLQEYVEISGRSKSDAPLRASTERHLITLPAEQRMGILTHPNWLVAHSDAMDNHVILRGKWIRERLLGGAIADVPITVDALLPDEPEETLRHRMRVTREKSCWTCHQKMDSLGLPFEMFNHAGLFRTTELGNPVNTKGEITNSGEASLDGPVSNALEMIEKLSRSERVKQVFVRHVFRYWMGRNETINDAPVLQDAYKAYVENDGSMKALLISLVTSDSFLYRKVQ